MLPKQVKQRIQERFGRPVNDSFDCQELTKEINKICGEDIDAGDFRHLYGIEYHSDKEILTVTYDAIARYVGYPYWSAIPRIGIDAPEITAEVVEIRTYWHSLYQALSVAKSAFLISLVIAFIAFVGYSQCNRKKPKRGSSSYTNSIRQITS